MSLPQPNLEISTVAGCIMNCGYCPQERHVRRYSERAGSGEFRMSLDVFKACLKTVPPEVEILFAGMAEPWLNRETTAMLLHAHAMGHRVGVYTTTVGLPPGDVEKIRHIPFLHFCLHLPDADGQMSLSVTDRYLAGLRAAMTIPSCTFMVIGPLHPRVREVLGFDVQDGSHSLISRAGNLPAGVAVKNIPPHKGEIRCSSTNPGSMDHNVLLPNGDVVLCCCDYNLDHVLGNLQRQTYAELFTSEPYLRVMRGWKDESIDVICRRCEIAVSV